MLTFENLDQALIGLASLLIDQGVTRNPRNQRCIEIPHPVTVEITNPCDRYVTIKQRKWNPTLPVLESIWMALGMNNLDSLPGRYVKALYDYSDNGQSWRAGYGPRLRAYSGIRRDYHVSDPLHRNVVAGLDTTTDQFEYVVKSLQRDIHTRQAIITIGDPPKDNLMPDRSLKSTRDYPCTREIQFMLVDGALNCTVFMRSNDLLYGFSAVNVPNFTMMQEYIANMIGVPVGKYYHIANNMHYYTNNEVLEQMVHDIAELDPADYPTMEPYQYEDKHQNLYMFDEALKQLYYDEKKLFHGNIQEILPLPYPMLDDWARILEIRNLKDYVPKFHNPYLTRLFDIRRNKYSPKSMNENKSLARSESYDTCKREVKRLVRTPMDIAMVQRQDGVWSAYEITFSPNGYAHSIRRDATAKQGKIIRWEPDEESWIQTNHITKE